MYICEGCFTCSKAGQPRLLYIQYRQCTYTNGGLTTTGREAVREIPVCATCKEELESGTSLAQVRYAATLDSGGGGNHPVRDKVITFTQKANDLLADIYEESHPSIENLEMATTEFTEGGQCKTTNVFDLLRQSRTESLPTPPSKQKKAKGKTLFERK